jgi:hypothetical protein
METVTGLAVIVVAAYFAPWLLAVLRRHHNAGAIFIINLFLGWTLLGWIVALVWSMTAVQPRFQRNAFAGKAETNPAGIRLLANECPRVSLAGGVPAPETFGILRVIAVLFFVALIVGYAAIHSKTNPTPVAVMIPSGTLDMHNPNTPAGANFPSSTQGEKPKAEKPKPTPKVDSPAVTEGKTWIARNCNPPAGEQGKQMCDAMQSKINNVEALQAVNELICTIARNCTDEDRRLPPKEIK